MMKKLILILIIVFAISSNVNGQSSIDPTQISKGMEQRLFKENISNSVTEDFNIEYVNSILGTSVRDVKVKGNYAYCVFANGLVVLDISDRIQPVLITELYLEGSGQSILLTDGYAYVADGSSDLQIIDINDPASLFFSGFCDAPGYARGVAVSGNYVYVANDGSLMILRFSNPTSISEQSKVSTYKLSQNYPNPFNPATNIQYSLPKTEYVTISVYNSLGQLMKTFVSEHKSTGEYSLILDGTNQSGIKAFQDCIKIDEFSTVKKILLMK